MKTKRRTLTPEELENAARLMAIFHQRKKQNSLTQAKLGEAVGMTQSGVGQYLNGEVPLNLTALILFSMALGCQLQDIDPDCPHLIPTSPEEKGLVAAYRDMKNRKDATSAKALLQVAELSPAYRATLEHNEDTILADPHS
jgi:transcriptional regulator with XRE-family HTH domain